jgi:hypothetical protein
MHDTIFIDNKYTSTYFRIINRAIDRNWTKKFAPVYTESHHIIPKSFDDGTNLKSNLVRLTAREHFIVHKLLIKMCAGKNKAKMISALFLMITDPKRKTLFSRLYSATSKAYNDLRIKHKESVSINQLGRIHNQAAKDKISKANTGRLLGVKKPEGFGEKISAAMTGKKKTEDHVNKINRNPEKIRKMAEKHRGMKRSDESKARMSKAKEGFIPWNKGAKGSMSMGKKWYTHSETRQTKMLDPNNVPEGFFPGRPDNKRGKSVDKSSAN